jgi:hypothetical protein
MMAVRLGVRWAGPASPLTHADGDHAAEVVVLGRDETLAIAVVKVVGLSAACPRIVKDAGVEFDPSA